MTSSSDSLIESARPISEDRARIEAALKVARPAYDRIVLIAGRDFGAAASFGCDAIEQIIRILDGGKS